MYNKEEEKIKTLEMLRKSQVERQYSKQHNFERAISFALDEVHELNQEYNVFLNRISHLAVFQHFVKEPFTTNTDKLFHNLKYMIEKNYTNEDKEAMPYEVLQQVKATQEKRIDLLKKVARVYMSKSKKN